RPQPGARPGAAAVRLAGRLGGHRPAWPERHLVGLCGRPVLGRPSWCHTLRPANPRRTVGRRARVHLRGRCGRQGESMSKQRVLFLCTPTSARSQMAEGLLRHLAGDRFEAYSAGTEATQVRPLAIAAMAELGIDISGQQSKTLERYLDEHFDDVITVCG